MTILTGILAVIGKILLILLLLIIVILALVLFVPLRYRAAVAGGDGIINADATVTWLKSAVSLSVRFRKENDESEKEINFYVLGVSPPEVIRKRREKKLKQRRDRQLKRISALKKEDPEKYEELKNEALARKKEKAEALRRQAESEPDGVNPKDAEEKHTKRGIKIAADLTRSADRAIRVITEKLVYFIVKIAVLPFKIVSRCSEAVQKVSRSVSRILNIADFLCDIRTRKAVIKLKRAVFKLLRHV